MARGRIGRRIGFGGCLRDEGVEAIEMMPHATLSEIYLPLWNVEKLMNVVALVSVPQSTRSVVVGDSKNFLSDKDDPRTNRASKEGKVET